LSRKVPEYVGRAKSVQSDNNKVIKEGLLNEYADAVRLSGLKISGNIQIGSVIFAVKPGDGSAREQAASCQRVLGGSANIAREYATKRYRSNLINWGMLPFINKDLEFKVNDIIIIPDIKDKVSSMAKEIKAALVREDGVKEITLLLDLDEGERDIILSGCLMNYYSNLSATKEKLL
jgi:aconitate hydratase